MNDDSIQNWFLGTFKSFYGNLIKDSIFSVVEYYIYDCFYNSYLECLDLFKDESGFYISLKNL